MKRWIKYVGILILLVIVSVFVYYSFFSQKESENQNEIVDTFGLPNQFSITYLPKGEDELIRQEVWYYPEMEMKVNFLGGKILNVEEYIQEGEIIATSLDPRDFDIYTTYDEIKAIAGENIEPLDFLPDFYIPGEIESYISDKTLFVIESEYLTYFETLGVVDE